MDHEGSGRKIGHFAAWALAVVQLGSIVLRGGRAMLEAGGDAQFIVQNREILRQLMTQAVDLFFSTPGAIITFIACFGYLIVDNRMARRATWATTPIPPRSLSSNIPSTLRRHAVPDFISDKDKDHLIKGLFEPPELKANRIRELKIQILYAARFAHLAQQFQDIASSANWTPVSAPLPIAPGAAVPRGLVIRSSLTDPAYAAANKLSVNLREIGLNPDSDTDAQLRHYDHCFLYLNE
jgi:hypothetical protein